MKTSTLHSAIKNISVITICFLLTAGNSYAITDALRIRIAKGTYSDETIIRFVAGATNGFDGSYDAWKLFSSNAAIPNIFSKDNIGDMLSINAMPSFTASLYTDVFLRIGTADTYSITPSEAGAFAQGVCIMMKDLVTGQFYDMRTSNTYLIPLPVIAKTDPARFRVFFSYPASVQTTSASCTNCTDGSATFTKAGESSWQYLVVNSSGSVAASGTSSSASYVISNLAAGAYTAAISSDYACTSTMPFTINGPVTYYSRASGNWSDVNTWSITGCGESVASSVPGGANNVVICSGNTVTMDVSSSCLDLTINEGTLSAASSFTVTGNWANNGTFSAGTQTVTFKGTRMQNISGSSVTTFNNITLNNSTPAEALRLNVPITVNGILGLKDGHITTTASTMITCNSSASISLLATLQDSSFVKGPMRHTVNVSSGVTKVFPVGKDNCYRRIDLTVDQKLATSTTYAAEMIDIPAVALGYSLPPSVSNVSYIRYHEITQSPSTTKLDMAQVRIYFGCAGIDDMVQSLSPISVVKDNGESAWVDLSDTPFGFTCNGTSYWGNALSGVFTSFTGTKFSLTGTGNPDLLSVELMNFTAKQVEENAEVSWTTASESNSNYFVVEKSKDGDIFDALEKVSAAGNSSATRNYSMVDYEPFFGYSYYRLKETDYDGSEQYSKVVSVYVENKNPLTVYPNPASGYCNVTISGNKGKESSIVISDMAGRDVFSHLFTLETDNETKLVQLGNEYTQGIYTMTVSIKQGVYKKKIVIGER